MTAWAGSPAKATMTLPRFSWGQERQRGEAPQRAGALWPGLILIRDEGLVADSGVL